MKVFISYRYTGEDLTVLEGIMDTISKSLEKAGHSSFSTFNKNKFFEVNKFTAKQVLGYAFNELDRSDVVLVFVKSQEKSEGMLLEVGYALAKGKKIILAIKKDVFTYFLPEIAERVIEYGELDELYQKLENLKLE